MSHCKLWKNREKWNMISLNNIGAWGNWGSRRSSGVLDSSFLTWSFDDAHVASDGRIFDYSWIVKYLEVNGPGLMEVISWHLPARIEVKYCNMYSRCHAVVARYANIRLPFVGWQIGVWPYAHVQTNDSFIHSSMSVQPFVGPWPLFQFRNPKRVGRTPRTGDQPVARPLPTHRTAQTQNNCKQTSMHWLGFETTSPMYEQAKIVQGLDRAATVIGQIDDY
jgi:hypothetical protein